MYLSIILLDLKMTIKHNNEWYNGEIKHDNLIQILPKPEISMLFLCYVGLGRMVHVYVLQLHLTDARIRY